MKYKLFNSKSTYTARLNLVNKEKSFPSKNYSKILRGKIVHFVADKIMTRTWADENPRETKLKQLPFPVSKEMEKDFTGLVEYDENWFPIESIESKILPK